MPPAGSFPIQNTGAINRLPDPAARRIDGPPVAPNLAAHHRRPVSRPGRKGPLIQDLGRCCERELSTSVDHQIEETAQDFPTDGNHQTGDR